MSERYGYGTYEDNENRADLQRPNGFDKDGSISGDYLEAGRDPELPRQTAREVDLAIRSLLEEKR